LTPAAPPAKKGWILMATATFPTSPVTSLLFVPVAPVAQWLPGFHHRPHRSTPNERLGLLRTQLIQRGNTAFRPWQDRTLYCETDPGTGHHSARMRWLRAPGVVVSADGTTIRRAAQLETLSDAGLQIRWWVPTEAGWCYPADALVDPAGPWALGARETISWADWFTETWRFWRPVSRMAGT
jgi:hypothetical protein